MSDAGDDGGRLPAEPDPDDPIPGEGDPVATGPKGGGGWPHPATPPTDSAPGSDPASRAAIQAERGSGTSTEDGPAADLHPE